MKETIIQILQVGSVWMFVCIVYWFVTMLFGAFLSDYEGDEVTVAHTLGCLLFGVMFCVWLYA